MQELKERRKKAASEADACEMIALLATVPAKKEAFEKLALHYKQMMQDLDAAIAAMKREATQA